MRRRFKRRIGRRPSKKIYTTSVVNSAVRPQRMLLKMPYFWSGQLYSETGNYQTYSFNLNSLYDPDRTGIGHQPLGRDQWIAFYNQYRVYRCTYQIVFNNLDPAQAATVGFCPTNGLPSFTNEAAFEQPQMRMSAIAPRDGQSKAIMKGSIDLARLNGKTHAQYKASEDTASQNSSSPAEILLGNLVAAPVLSGAPVNVGYTIKLTFHAELFDPNVLPIS